MLNLFALIGLLVLSLAGIMAVTALCGWTAKDDDGTLKWFLSSIIAAVFVSLTIMTNIA